MESLINMQLSIFESKVSDLEVICHCMSSYSFSQFKEKAGLLGFEIVSKKETKNHPKVTLRYIGDNPQFSKKEFEVRIASTPSCKRGLQNILSVIRNKARSLVKEETMPNQFPKPVPLLRESIDLGLLPYVEDLMSHLRQGWSLCPYTTKRRGGGTQTKLYLCQGKPSTNSNYVISGRLAEAGRFLINGNYLQEVDSYKDHAALPTQKIFVCPIMPQKLSLTEESAPSASKVAEEIGLTLPDSPKKREILGALQNLPEGHLNRLITVAATQLEEERDIAERILQDAKDMLLEAERDLKKAQEEFDQINPLTEALKRAILT